MGEGQPTESTDSMEWVEVELARVTPLLAIKPDDVAAAFWTSEEYQRFVHIAHNWAVCILLVTSAFLLRRLWLQPHTTFIVSQGYAVIMNLLLNGVQWCVITSAPPEKGFAERKLWFVSTRLLLVLSLFPLAVGVRRSTAKETLASMAGGILYNLEAEPTACTALRNMVALTGGVWPLLHGIAAPLLFYHQLCAGLIAFILLFVVQFRPAVHLLHNAGPTTGIHSVCTSINEMQFMVEATLWGVPMDIQHRTAVCAEHHVLVASMFVFILACSIPIYISYRLEWYVKMQYLHRLCDDHTDIQLPIYMDAFVTVCFVTTAWVVCVCWHDILLGLTLPPPSEAT